MEANKVDSAAPSVGCPTAVHIVLLRKQMGLRKNPEAAQPPQPPEFCIPTTPSLRCNEGHPAKVSGVPATISLSFRGVPRTNVSGVALIPRGAGSGWDKKDTIKTKFVASHSPLKIACWEQFHSHAIVETTARPW